MSTQEAFWSRVQAALDARENPIEDALVEEALVEHPEWLAGLLALTERIQALPAPVHPAPVHHAQAHPAQVHPAQALPAQVHPAQVLPAQVHPAQVLPAQVHPAPLPVARPIGRPVSAGPFRAGPLRAAPRRVAAAAGLLLALGLCVRPPARTPEEVPSAATLDAPVGRILDWSITVRHIRQDSRSCVHNVNGHLSTEGASLEQTPPLPGATVVASMRLARSVPPPPHSR